MDNGDWSDAPVWVARFLAALADGNGVRRAAREAGVTSSTPYHRRDNDPKFRAAWDAIQPVDDRRRKKRGPRPDREAERIEVFLDELALTSNVVAAAAVADIPTSRIYRLRRENPEFARRWQVALAEGYDNLEMELLQHLRAVEVPASKDGPAGKDGPADKDAPPKRKFDIATALRCLTAHRDSVAREKGRRSLADEVVTIASINAKIDAMRLRAKESDAAIRKARKANANKTSGDDGA